MSEIIFPRRDLPGASDNWGRAVERGLSGVVGKLTGTSQGFNNDSRATSGELAVLSSQIDELSERKVRRLPIPNFSVTGPANSLPPRETTQTVHVEGGVGGTRGALVFVTLDSSETGSVMSSKFVEVLFEGVPVFRGRVFFDSTGYYTDGVFQAFFPIQIPEVGGELSIRAIKVGFSSTSTTWSLTGGQVTVQYGDVV